MNRINIFRNKSLKSIILGSLLLGSFAFSHLQASDTPLIEAAADGDVVRVRQLLTGGVYPNETDELGNTPLHFANTPAKINLLCENGANVNARNNDGNTPLHSALYRAARYPGNQEYIECIKALLAKNANPIIVNAIGVTSVSIAQDVVSGAAINAGDNTPVVVGAGARTAFGEILAQLKAVINPLHYAVVNDDDGKVEQLLDARADPNLIDRFGNAPLHYAHTPKIIELLCKCGAEPNKQDKEGNTPLHNAVFAEELDLERIGALLKCNAKTNIVNREGFTPLSFVGKVISYGRIRWLYDFEELDAEKRSVFIQAKQLLERYSRR